MLWLADWMNASSMVVNSAVRNSNSPSVCAPSGPRPYRCAWWPTGRRTSTSSRASAAGTWLRAVSSWPRRAAWWPIPTVRPPDPMHPHNVICHCRIAIRCDEPRRPLCQRPVAHRQDRIAHQRYRLLTLATGTDRYCMFLIGCCYYRCCRCHGDNIWE